MNHSNFHVIEVIYLPITDHEPSRVRLKSHRFKEQVTIEYNFEFNSAMDVALDYLEKRKFNIVGKAESRLTAGFIIVDSRDDYSFTHLNPKNES